MVKVAWLCNFPTRDIAVKENLMNVPGEGWIEGMLDGFKMSGEVDVSITLIFPQDKQKTMLMGELNKIKYFGYYERNEKGNGNSREYLQNAIDMIAPDILHLNGTEFKHSEIAAEIAKKKGIKTIVSMQGVLSSCQTHVLDGVPVLTALGFTFRDFIRFDNLYVKKKKFEKRAQSEIRCLRTVDHAIGRTEYDKAYVRCISTSIRYYKCGENLRSVFYEDRKWSIDSCNKKSIFISQSYLPFKGFHIALEGLAILKKIYPDLTVRISGWNITAYKTLNDKLRITSYGRYLRKLIQKYDLRENLEFIGVLDKVQMKEELMKANVFLLPSVIENSPNSLGEAMLTGTPVVAANVGGVCDIITHEKEGVLYQWNEPVMLAHSISRIFDDDKIADYYSKNAEKRASCQYDRELNARTLVNIYKKIIGSSSVGD